MSFPDQTNSSLCANRGHWQLPFSSYSNRFESELEGLDCSSESIASQQIPKWWLWMYYLTPTSWTLKGMLTSQYGDVHTEIMVFGETKTISDFLRDYFGYHYHDLHIVGAVLIRYPIVFASLFAICIEKLNFQRR